jgi:hypothetical protein
MQYFKNEAPCVDYYKGSEGWGFLDCGLIKAA